MARLNRATWLVILSSGPLVAGCTTAGDEATAVADASAMVAPDTAPGDALMDAAADAAPPDAESPCENAGTAGATAGCLTPTRPPEHYVAEALAYFDTLDVDADPESVPAYSERVARWEWPPWLLLTGLGRQDMIDTGKLLKAADPSTVPERDCRAFDTQPFARCRVVFQYEGGPCPIYEEFTFNDAGEMTFIEAWSDLPGLHPGFADTDPWGERGIDRLSTRIPGLGTEDGAFDLESPFLIAAAEADPDVADFARRAADWWVFWFEAVNSAPPDFFARGCGWGPSPDGATPAPR